MGRRADVDFYQVVPDGVGEEPGVVSVIGEDTAKVVGAGDRAAGGLAELLRESFRRVVEWGLWRVTVDELHAKALLGRGKEREEKEEDEREEEGESERRGCHCLISRCVNW